MCDSLNRSKTQGEQEINLKIDQIKEKIDELTVKRAYKVEIVHIWTDLTKESWRWSLDSDKSVLETEDE